jgi:sulfatase maturation enzyme AslB (radical SAM superfamily)
VAVQSSTATEVDGGGPASAYTPPVHLPVAFAGRRWLEIALDYRCNLRCLGCHACHDTGERLASSEVLAIMRSGRARGIEGLWLGGGEPTLRDDLLSVVRAARELGYAQVVVQTNGMRLAYPDYRAALMRAGVSEIRLNVKSHRADLHDRLSGAACHGLLLEGLEGLREAGVRVAADLLLTRSTTSELAETVTFFAARGVQSFALWLLSAADAPDQAVAAEVPRIADIIPALAAARDVARAAGIALTSLHTPRCTLPAELRDLFVPANALSLVVVGPGRRLLALRGAVALWRPEGGLCGGARAGRVRPAGVAS